VIDELCAYLLEHARGEDLALASRPQILFHTDESLQLGEFGIEARLARLEEEPPESEEQGSPAPDARRSSGPDRRRSAASVDLGGAVAPHPSAAPPAASAHSVAHSGSSYAEPEEGGNTMIFSNSQRTRDAVGQTGARRRPKALLLVAGRRLLVAPRGATLGRSRDCDIVLEDSSISRRHAELRPGSQGWVIEDLGSTNGVRVNGNTVHGPQEVRTGDRIEIGSTEMLFEIAP
jgi:predicted component of type VI protein secretion system